MDKNLGESQTSLYYKNLIDSVNGLKEELDYMKRRTPDENIIVTPLSKDIKGLARQRTMRKMEDGVLVSGVIENNVMKDAEIVGIHESAPQHVKDSFTKLVNGRIGQVVGPTNKNALQSKFLALFSKEYDRAERKFAAENKTASPVEITKTINLKKIINSL